MSQKLTSVIKTIAKEAVEASSPVTIVFGEVTSASPLKIRLNQLLEIGEESTIQTSTVDGQLATGDSVILLRQQGGQKYIVLDKYEVTT